MNLVQQNAHNASNYYLLQTMKILIKEMYINSKFKKIIFRLLKNLRIKQIKFFELFKTLKNLQMNSFLLWQLSILKTKINKDAFQELLSIIGNNHQVKIKKF